MARPKEFEREEVLERALKVFADQGFEGTSTDALMHAMGISRQSLYDSFGDKRSLYLETLRYYRAKSVSDLIHNLYGGSSPLKELEAALLTYAAKPTEEAPLGCLGVARSVNLAGRIKTFPSSPT
jgi:TetR/AcrR family transcriptional repressor of nem operon